MRMSDHPPQAPALQRQAFDHLLARFDASAGEPPATRWPWLEAAHVLGQTRLGLHWRSHTAMLRYALQLRDGSEVLGQLLRLALVSLGHLLQRLPLGNIGRAHVSALSPMATSADTADRINAALRAMRSPDL
ncbi:hypothetical protein ASE28_05235 [Acidovorax sp. Root219]|nr:hypothetical protein ASE28_05235 [Acidovorax sp. Root219]